MFSLGKPGLETTQAHTDAYVEKSYEFQVVLEWPSKEEKFDITYRVNQQASRLVVTRGKDNGACGKHNWQVRRLSHRSPVWLQQIVANNEIAIVNGERDPQNMRAHTDICSNEHSTD